MMAWITYGRRSQRSTRLSAAPHTAVDLGSGRGDRRGARAAGCPPGRRRPRQSAEHLGDLLLAERKDALPQPRHGRVARGWCVREPDRRPQDHGVPARWPPGGGWSVGGRRRATGEARSSPATGCTMTGRLVDTESGASTTAMDSPPGRRSCERACLTGHGRRRADTTAARTSCQAAPAHVEQFDHRTSPSPWRPRRPPIRRQALSGRCRCSHRPVSSARKPAPAPRRLHERWALRREDAGAAERNLPRPVCPDVRTRESLSHLTDASSSMTGPPGDRAVGAGRSGPDDRDGGPFQRPATGWLSSGGFAQTRPVLVTSPLRQRP
jgi:hypothetical protein